MKFIQHIENLRHVEFPDQYIRKLEWDGVISKSEIETLRIYAAFRRHLETEEA